jgi:oligogalacturonide lyase
VRTSLRFTPPIALAVILLLEIASCAVAEEISTPSLASSPISGISASRLGFRSHSECSAFIDEVTGATVARLTSSAAKDNKIYQTHPNWISDGSHLVFHSDRTGRDEVFAMEGTTGEIVQLTDGDSGAFIVARHENAIYVVSDNRVFSVNLTTLFADSKARAMRIASAYRHEIAGLPEDCSVSGTFTEDANGETLYFGLVDSKAAYSIQQLDTKSARFSKVIDVGFKVGHCQAHPTKAGIISYCHETGGDTDQRMWITNSDGTGNHPFYTESYSEWVTHETWWTADRMLFVIWPKNEQMKLKPYGIASVSLTESSHLIHDQYPYWHVCGTPDGKYAIGDTFDGKLFLVDIHSGTRRLLTQGHRPKGAQSHQHQSISPDGKRVLFVSSKFGNWDLMTVDIPRGEKEILPEVKTKR